MRMINVDLDFGSVFKREVDCEETVGSFIAKQVAGSVFKREVDGEETVGVLPW